MDLFIVKGIPTFYVYMDVMQFFHAEVTRCVSSIWKPHNHAPITPLLYKPNKGYFLPLYL